MFNGKCFLVLHLCSVIHRMQVSAYKEGKTELKEGELLVVCDFAENYSFVVQDEIQSFHWNNDPSDNPSFCRLLQI